MAVHIGGEEAMCPIICSTCQISSDNKRVVSRCSRLIVVWAAGTS